MELIRPPFYAMELVSSAIPPLSVPKVLIFLRFFMLRKFLFRFQSNTPNCFHLLGKYIYVYFLCCKLCASLSLPGETRQKPVRGISALICPGSRLLFWREVCNSSPGLFKTAQSHRCSRILHPWSTRSPKEGSVLFNDALNTL